MTLAVEAAGYDQLAALRDLFARHRGAEIVWTAMVLRQWVHNSLLIRNYDPQNGADWLFVRLQENAERHK
ncbi:hypothetical protein LC092_07475 [Stappia stellulata]|uniref:hypothetical protein n=1 Tax=Stappia stellulata TaxID=71235 RepID=UPI001CD40554|nr:hypothetical protein [Stappia stellulata]MCA1242273.1 hypothetical protein [Stappia stellulata]